MLKREKIYDQNRRNVFGFPSILHGCRSIPEGCDSETVTVGGLDNVDTRVVEQFDYVALGHLHSPQNVGNERIRYCGTLLKYSVSEAEHQKSITVVTLGREGNASAGGVSSPSSPPGCEEEARDAGGNF